MAGEHDDMAETAARLGFRNALVRAHETRAFLDELDEAAMEYCHVLRDHGCSPEGTLVNVKRVILEAIDDRDRMVTERAVLSCIQGYYRN